MPVYEYLCPTGHVTQEYRTVEGRSTDATCRCGEAAVKAILTPPKVFADFEGYESPASGKWISGKRARLEDMKRTGCREYDPGEKADWERRKVTEAIAEDKAIDAVVEQTLTDLTL